MKSKVEKKFINQLSHYKEYIFTNEDNAVMEGFEYFKTPEYQMKPHAVHNRAKCMLAANGSKELLRLLNHMRKRGPSMFRNINRNFTDMNTYLHALETKRTLPQTPIELQVSYPNTELWETLQKEAWDQYKVMVGFTKVPKEHIFKGKCIPFEYALVFVQEMQKEPIEKAPKLDAGMEVVNVYNSLGIATNEINHWLRERYGIIGMANHPLGGLVDFIPLAEKAGMGKIGHHGLLITKPFGPRCRISPIFIDTPLFEVTDHKEHDWIEAFCKKCRSCERNCPTQAIYETARLSVDYQNGLLNNRYEAFDREKCFTSFSATMGCAVCIKSCPFSKNPTSYDKLKEKYS